MSTLAAELNLLRAAARLVLARHGMADEANADVAALLAEVNWHHVLWLGHQHEAWPLLHSLVSDSRWRNRCPAEVVAQLDGVFQASRLHTLEQTREQCLVHDVFARESIPAIVAPHAVTAGVEVTAYRFAPKALPAFWVAGENIPRAVAALEAAGHPCTIDFTQLTHRGQRPVVLNEHLGSHPAAARARARAEAFSLGGRTMQRPAPIHALLDRAARAAGRMHIPIGAAWEIVALAHDQLGDGGDALAREAACFGLKAAVFSVLATSHEALGLPLPPAVAARMNRPADTSAVARTPVKIVNAPYLSTPLPTVARMLQLAGTGANDVVYDLGCGDGRIVIAAAREFGAWGVGIDADPARVNEARAGAAAAGVAEKTRFSVGDVFETDLREASVVCLFLYPTFFPRLQGLLRRQARPGTRIVSHDYAFTDWPPEKMEILRTAPAKICPVFLWRVPERNARHASTIPSSKV